MLLPLIHCRFAGSTAPMTAALPVLLAAGVAIPGMNMVVCSLLPGFTLGIMGILTPYAAGPGASHNTCGIRLPARRRFLCLCVDVNDVLQSERQVAQAVGQEGGVNAQ